MHERRAHPRVPLGLAVRCERPGAEGFGGTARDISVGGMFIEAAEAPAFGAELTIVCRLPGSGEAWRLPAVVRWTKDGGFGVQFGLLGVRETHAIARVVKP